MAFKLVYLSQQDPKWKNDTLGFGDPGDTIGFVGCALTSVSMLLSGHGFEETPQSLNKKLQANQGFVSSGIRWDVVCQVHPQLRLRENIRCETTDAPLDRINAALDAGQPVVVRVDASPNPGLQWHYVLLYARKDDDYLMLDPWPYQPGIAKEDFLMKRYSQGRSLKQAIQQVLLYEVTGAGGPITTPSSSTTTGTTSTQPTTSPTPTSGVYARVMDSVTWGLNIRTSADTSSMANVVVTVPAGTQLMLLDSDDAAKIGKNDKWVRVREPGGKEGLAAAWFLEKVGAAAPAPTTEPDPGPVNEPPVTPSTTPAVGRSRPSIGDGLENVPLAVSADQRINDNSLLARIWNKYGGLLSTIAQKMNFDPAIAVAILAVESGGQPYGPDGRLIIRFENHLFFEYWGKRNTTTYNDHFKSSSPIWTGHQWRPKANAAWRDFHGNQSAEWEVLTFASKLDDTAAKKSISMGLPQVLGSNFGILGFASVQDMFNAFVANERNQVVAFFDFLQGNGSRATNALKTRDFRTIASIYNGAGNADHYGKLIQNLYNTFIGLRGNPPPVSPTPITPPATPTTPDPSAPVEPPTAPTPASAKLQVIVKTNGTKIYSTAISSSVISTEKAGARLTVVEPADPAKAKIGVKGKRINVKATNNKRGYVDAENVKSA
jgi:hypothetical protein